MIAWVFSFNDQTQFEKERYGRYGNRMTMFHNLLIYCNKSVQFDRLFLKTYL